MKIKNKIKNGFTLVELLVVISIISILTVISVSSYTSAQIKSRDSQRKSDLDSVSKALLMYYNDTGSFPNLTSSQLFENSDVGLTGANAIVYMRQTPQDPKKSSDSSYFYVYKTDGKLFNLFAKLENRKDSQCQTTPYLVVDGKNYCYGISSPNSVVKNW